MPAGRRELQEVDVIAEEGVLQDRPVLDLDRWHRTAGADLVAPRSLSRLAVEVDRQADREQRASLRVLNVAGDPVARLIAFDAVEQEAGPLALEIQLGKRPDLQIPIGPFHQTELANLIACIQEMTKVFERHWSYL